jgi:predicted dehydrogenase
MAKLAWGLIGCGDIARKRVAQALNHSPSSELVAVSRARAELAEGFAKEFNARKWFSDWRELLRDNEVDAVYVATPVHLHLSQTIAAAESGKHVLCEKPMAMNVAESEQMISACRANDVKFGVAYYRHFYPVIERIKDLLAMGEIGNPIVAQINAFEWFDPGPDGPRSWLLKKELSGGGPMFDFGCHRIEVLLNLFGEIQNVQATVANVHYSREVEDTAVVLFRFASGMCATLTVSHVVSEPRDTFDLFGSRGSIHVNVLNKGQMMVITEKGERIESHPPAANLHQPLIDDFAESVLVGREPRVGGRTGKMVAEIEEKIYRAPV